MKKYIVVTMAFVMLSVTFGCKKSYLDTVPSDAVSDKNLFTTTESCLLVLDGLERLMITTGASYLMEGGTTRANDWGESTIRFEEDNLGMDMPKTPNNYDWFTVCYNYTGIRQPSYNIAQMPWRLYYKLINSANQLLDHIDEAKGPDAEKEYIKGQAYAYRAYSYYKLSIYYCTTYSLGREKPGLPIYLKGSDATTRGVGRSTVGDVYDLIISDLKAARTNLESTSTMNGRTMSDISLATLYGIYAKVALVMNDWGTAADMADLAITTSGKTLMSAAEYKDGFNSRSNPEWMWCSTLTGTQTQDALNRCFFSFVDPTSSTSYASTGISTTMAKATLDIMRLMNDVRSQTFTSTRQQTKFHLATPDIWQYDLLYMRLAEMYLTKAEALAEQNKNAEAIAALTTLVDARNPGYDYNSTVKRYLTANAPLPDAINKSLASAKSDLLKEIRIQRRIELYLEGVAYADMQRWKSGLFRPSGAGNYTVSTAGVLTIPANDPRFLYKIPQQEFDANPALAGQQNP